jgi:hypothetical protein
LYTNNNKEGGSMFEYTKNEIDEISRKELVKLINHVGDKLHLSRMLNVSQPTVIGWSQRGRISKKGARLVEIHPRLKKKFTAEQLRPDVDI